MNAPSSSLSPELLKANQRLHELRQLAQSNKAAAGSTGQTLPWEGTSSEDSFSTVDAISQMPTHLGWGSVSASLAIRAALGRPKLEPDAVADEPLRADHPPFRSMSNGSHSGGQPLGVSEHETIATQLRLPLDGDTVKHYPSIGIAALKTEQAAIYRVWLMCRYLDVNGRGWLPVQDVREKLTGKDAKLRLFCWRRLRQILGSGHDRFWKWDKQNGRLWLFGAARVAAGLAVSRLSGLPVALPVAVAAAAIGEFKAHLYGAWHSGRRKSNPITRREQETITGVPERTQRAYCKTANVVRKRNIAIGNRYTEEAFKKNAWRYGQVFEFVDHHGQHGQAGRAYIAWQMPNSYTGTHQKTAKGRMRKINRKLKDLVTLGAQGNSGGNVDKLYYANGGEAGRAFNRNTDKDAYWPLHVSGQRRQADLWSVFFME